MKEETTQAAIVKSLWLKAATFSRQLDNSLGAIHGIGLTEYMVLHNLIEAPTDAMRRIDVADALGRTASGVTRMLKPMEKIGLVEKVSSERDARVSLVRISEAGTQIYKDATLTLEQRSDALLQNLPGKKAETFLSLLNAID